jgi:DNA-binding transcriptional regulator YdaS (Cro superfamily)
MIILNSERPIASDHALQRAIEIVAEQALQRAIAHAGGQRALGRALGITAQSLRKWHKAPAERVLDIERITGISRELLRPDIYPPGSTKPQE